jgi:hypothetical protein
MFVEVLNLSLSLSLAFQVKNTIAVVFRRNIKITSYVNAIRRTISQGQFRLRTIIINLIAIY